MYIRPAHYYLHIYIYIHMFILIYPEFKPTSEDLGLIRHYCINSGLKSGPAALISDSVNPADFASDAS